MRNHLLPFILASALTASAAMAQTPDASMVQLGTDIPAKWKAPEGGYDFVRREVMIPMRDGVKLHTVILVPNDAKDLPMLLERTPYEADGAAKKGQLALRDSVRPMNREWVDDGYILVHQDIRGKYGSEGKYVMTRP